MTTPAYQETGSNRFNRPLGPFAVLYEQRPIYVKPKVYEKHPALKGRDYTAASAMCTTNQERDALKARFIAKWNVEQVLRVNPYSELGRSGSPTNSELAPR
jgi:hypothetical protein